MNVWIALSWLAAGAVAGPPNAESAALGAHGEWVQSLNASVVDCWQRDPAAATAVWEAVPMTARHGRPVFVQPVPEGFGAVVAERLVHRDASTAERVALVDWLRRSQTPAFVGWAAGLLTERPPWAGPEVRAALVESLRYGAGPAVVDGLRAGLTDDDAGVRHAAVRSLARIGDRATMPLLVGALDDASDDVAGVAARSLGWHGHAAAFDAVATVLGRADAAARLHALRALQRLDPVRAAAHPRVRALVSDPDPRVARAAAQILES